MSNELIHKVEQVFIDEEGKHVIISIKIIFCKGGNKKKTPSFSIGRRFCMVENVTQF
jgi:hypothetical protein